METRPTKYIETPIGKQKIALNLWITGRESEYIQEPILNMATVKAVAGRAEVGEISSSAITEANHRTIEKMVVAVDGSADGILDKILDMQKGDFEYVLAAIEETLKKK